MGIIGVKSQRRVRRQGFALQPTKGDFSRKVPFGNLQKLYSKDFLDKIYGNGGVFRFAVPLFVRAGDRYLALAPNIPTRVTHYV